VVDGVGVGLGDEVVGVVEGLEAGGGEGKRSALCVLC
jgi:hypothetical protein